MAKTVEDLEARGRAPNWEYIFKIDMFGLMHYGYRHLDGYRLMIRQEGWIPWILNFRKTEKLDGHFMTKFNVGR